MGSIKSNNRDRGAFACIANDYFQDGLTKREYFALHLMQGLIVSCNDTDYEYLSKISIKAADELLDALSETNPSNID